MGWVSGFGMSAKRFWRLAAFNRPLHSIAIARMLYYMWKLLNQLLHSAFNDLDPQTTFKTRLCRDKREYLKSCYFVIYKNKFKLKLHVIKSWKHHYFQINYFWFQHINLTFKSIPFSNCVWERTKVSTLCGLSVGISEFQRWATVSGTCYLCLITFCRAIKSSIIVLLLALIAVIQTATASDWPKPCHFGPFPFPFSVRVLAVIIYAFQLAKGATQTRCWNLLSGRRSPYTGLPDRVCPRVRFIYGSVIMIKHLSSACSFHFGVAPCFSCSLSELQLP